MREAAANLEFEVAALLRDQLNELRAMGAPDVRRGAAARRSPATRPALMRALTEPELVAEGEALGRGAAAGRVVAPRRATSAPGRPPWSGRSPAGSACGEPATSPTYALVHRYAGRRGPVFHLDCYRLRRRTRRPISTGRDLLAEGDALLIEWPERAGGWVPEPTRRFRLSHLADPVDAGWRTG